MAVTLTSSTQSEQEMMDALEAHGQTVVADAPPPAADKSSVPAPAPGESPEAPAGESVPASEAGKPKQETQEAKPEVTAEPKRRDNFESRRVRLEKERDRLREDLEYERTGRTTLEQRLATAEAELAKLKPADAGKDQGPVQPVAPAFPRREADDYDGSKYEQAVTEYSTSLAKYNADMSAYHAEMTKKTVAAELAKRAEDDKQRVSAEAAEREEAEWRTRVSEQSKAFDDWNDLVAEMPEEAIPTTELFDLTIKKAENSAILVRHFMLDYLDNNSVERNRILAIQDPIRMVKAMDRLEAKLLSEVKPKAEEPPAPAPVPAAVAPPTPAPERPARPRHTPPPADPIEPVGSRAGASTASLAKAGSLLEYARMRGTGVSR